MRSVLSVFTGALCLLLATRVYSQLPGCTEPAGVEISPSTNQTVPQGMEDLVSYTCTVRDGMRADWFFLGIQVSIESQSSITFLAGIGVNITFTTGATSNVAHITINRAGREFYSNNNLPIACAEFDTTSISIRRGCERYVRTFEIPTEPQNLQFNHFPGNLTRLVLTWGAPANTITDSGDPVFTSYTVKVIGATHNFTQVSPWTRFEFNDNPDSECAEHHIRVYASNGAGKGDEALLNETVPISPDIDDLSAQLRINSVTMGSPITVEISFPKAEACSDNFLVDRYQIEVMGVVTTAFSANDSRIVGRDLITLTSSAMAIQPDMAYSLAVAACISVTCRESSAVNFNTSDVQSASVRFFQSNVFLSCSFASNTQAQGCLFVFSVGPNITEEFTITLPATSSCEQILNMENVYTSIVAVDIESDGSRGTLAIAPVRSSADSVEDYMASTGCIPPAVGLTSGAVGGIVVAILLVLLISAAVVTVTVCLALRSKKKSETDGVAVECQDCGLPEAKPLLHGGEDMPDGAHGAPPSPVSEKLEFNLNPGRRNGKIVMDRNMLRKLTERMGSGDSVEYEFLVPEKSSKTPKN